MNDKNLHIEHKGEFEVIGYYKDIYLNGKYHGSINIDELDREQIGWNGKRTEITTEEIRIKNKKIIRIGTRIDTMVYPLNGRVIKD